MQHEIDEIHKTQVIFRNLLDSMSRPGKINQLPQLNNSFVGERSFSSFLYGIGITLLDQEVSFHYTCDDETAIKQLRLQTLSSHETIKDCDYLFLNGAEWTDLLPVKKGDFLFPDDSVTVICEVDLLSQSYIEHTIEFTLKGPGIKEENTLYIRGLDPRYVEQWQEINKEVPLGIDWIFVDKTGLVSCVPRSTQFEWKEQ